MDSLWQDIRYAFRQLARHRAASLAAILTLGLGIGAGTAIFTVVNRVLLTPLPYREPDQLMMVWEHNIPRNASQNVVSPENFFDWKDRATSFSDLAAYTWARITLTGGGTPEMVFGRAVTPNLFDVLGASPAVGRSFTADEGRPGGARVVILSDRLWQRRFARDPNIIGSTIAASGGDAHVVGVMPAGFRALANEEYWEPFKLDPANRERRGRYATVLGRLKPGVTHERAQAEMTAIASQLAGEQPAFNTGWSANVVALSDQVVGSSRSVLWLLLGAVGLLLLIMCGNVGSLMLARAISRRREIAVRTALGATGGRLARQWLIENIGIALAGGTLGVLIAAWSVSLLLAARPAAVPRLGEIGMDMRVIAIAVGVSLLVGLATGLPAILNQRGRRVGAILRDATGRTTAGAQASRVRATLMTAQVALAFMLLLGAGLLVRSIQRISSVDPGFDPTNVISLAVDLPPDAYPTPESRTAFYDRLAEQATAVPGVASAGTINFLPFTGAGAATGFSVVGRPAPAPGQAPVANIRVVDTGYFAAMRVPMRGGRTFASTDRTGAPPVVVISETLAREIWPGTDPVGQHLQIAYADPAAQPEVIGVVGDVHDDGLDADVRSTIYYAFAQVPSGATTLVMRTTGSPSSAIAGVRSMVRSLDPRLPVSDVPSMETLMSQYLMPRRLPMVLLTVFAGLAVILAAIGVYGVLSYAVSQGTREIGVRMAFGARPAAVLKMMLTRGLKPIVMGMALGAIGGSVAARALGHLLWNVTPTDPVTLVSVGGLLGAIALVAVYVPARRAMRVDPVVALRQE